MTNVRPTFRRLIALLVAYGILCGFVAVAQQSLSAAIRWNGAALQGYATRSWVHLL